MNHRHFMRICRHCGTMIAQCRCNAPKTIEYIDRCWQCAQTVRPPAHPPMPPPSEPTLRNVREPAPSPAESTEVHIEVDVPSSPPRPR